MLKTTPISQKFLCGIHTHTHTHTHTHMYIYIYTHTYIHTHIYMYIHIHTLLLVLTRAYNTNVIMTADLQEIFSNILMAL